MASRDSAPSVVRRNRGLMTVSRNESEGLPHSPELEESQRLYQSLTEVFGRTLTREFRLSEAEANDLLQQAVCGYLQLTVPTSDPEMWLIEMVGLKAEALYRERLAPRERTARGLQALPADAHKALELRFRHGWSYEDIAAELNVTVKYARHLVAAAARKLR